MTYALCMLDKQGYKSLRTCTRTHAHTEEYVILFAFPRKEWIRERTSMLRYTYIPFLLHYTCA